MYLYSVYDSLANRWHHPMTLDGDEVAKRAFMGSVPESPMAHQPSDFTLMRVGSFNPETGEVVGETPERVMTAFEAVHLLNQVDVPKLQAVEGGN